MTLRDWRRAVDDAIPKLNAGQRAVFDAVVDCILPGVSSSNLEAPVSSQGAPQNAQSRVFFLDAPGGTGKTFVTRAIHDFLRLREKIVVAVATSAIAAVLLDEGRTAAFNVQDTDTHYCGEHMQHFRQISAGTGPSRYRLHYLG